MRNLSIFQKFADTAGAEAMREQLIRCCCFTHNFVYHKNTKCTLNFGLKSLKNFAHSRSVVLLSLYLFTFLHNDNVVFSSTSTFLLSISSVHFKAHPRGYLLR